jgi:hypothetical protein
LVFLALGSIVVVLWQLHMLRAAVDIVLSGARLRMGKGTLEIHMSIAGTVALKLHI